MDRHSGKPWDQARWSNEWTDGDNNPSGVIAQELKLQAKADNILISRYCKGYRFDFGQFQDFIQVSRVGAQAGFLLNEPSFCQTTETAIVFLHIYCQSSIETCTMGNGQF